MWTLTKWLAGAFATWICLVLFPPPVGLSAGAALGAVSLREMIRQERRRRAPASSPLLASGPSPAPLRPFRYPSYRLESTPPSLVATRKIMPTNKTHRTKPAPLPAHPVTRQPRQTRATYTGPPPAPARDPTLN